MRADGYFRSGSQEADTQQCVHCGAHFIMIKGSGTVRGFCRKCNGITCGARDCMAVCIPFEAQLEHAEGRRTPYTDRILEQFGR